MYSFQLDLEKAEVDNGRDAISVQRMAYQELLRNRVNDLEAWRLVYNIAPDCARVSLRYAMVTRLNWDDVVEVVMALVESPAQYATSLPNLIYYCEPDEMVVFANPHSVQQFKKRFPSWEVEEVGDE